VVDAAQPAFGPDAQKAEITQLAEDINKATTRQFVVATIPDLQGYDIPTMAISSAAPGGSGRRTPRTASC
jgi:uncharacterized protein